MYVPLTCYNFPKLAKWIVSAIGVRDNNIKEATATIDEQADDLATLKQQIINKVKEVSVLEGINTRKDAELAKIKAHVTKKDTEIAALKAQVAKKNTVLATVTTTLVRLVGRNKDFVTVTPTVALLKRCLTKLKKSKVESKKNRKVTNVLRGNDVTTLKTKPNNIALRKCKHKSKKKRKAKVSIVSKAQVTAKR